MYISTPSVNSFNSSVSLIFLSRPSPQAHRSRISTPSDNSFNSSVHSDEYLSLDPFVKLSDRHESTSVWETGDPPYETASAPANMNPAIKKLSIAGLTVALIFRCTPKQSSGVTQVPCNFLLSWFLYFPFLILSLSQGQVS